MAMFELMRVRVQRISLVEWSRTRLTRLAKGPSVAGGQCIPAFAHGFACLPDRD